MRERDTFQAWGRGLLYLSHPPHPRTRSLDEASIRERFPTSSVRRQKQHDANNFLYIDVSKWKVSSFVKNELEDSELVEF